MFDMPPTGNFEIWTHPDNYGDLVRSLRDACHSAVNARCPVPWDDLGLPIRTVSHLQKRATETIWHPPADGRFVEYGPEDEGWMRPLGIGRLETIDKGPFIVLVDRSKLMKLHFGLFDFPRVTEPRFLITSVGF